MFRFSAYFHISASFSIMCFLSAVSCFKFVSFRVLIRSCYGHYSVKSQPSLCIDWRRRCVPFRFTLAVLFSSSTRSFDSSDREVPSLFACDVQFVALSSMSYRMMSTSSSCGVRWSLPTVAFFWFWWRLISRLHCRLGFWMVRVSPDELVGYFTGHSRQNVA